MPKKLNTSRSQISYFNTGLNYSANFFTNADVEGSATSNADEVIAKKALVVYEGSFKDSNSREHSFDVDRLNTIVENTNKALDTGVNIPLCTDHKKEFNSTVGNVEGHAYTKVIEPEDLPNPKAQHLVGKLGLFLDNVVVKAKDAVESVRKNIVTSVSMGLNLDPNDHRIMELSLVPIPAIPNMGLFKAAGLGSDDSNAFTWEDLEKTDQTLDDMQEEYSNLTDSLWTILNNIYTSESIDISDLNTLKQYVYNALNGFSMRTIDLLGLTDVPDASGMPQDAGTLTADQSAQMQQIQAQDLTSQSQPQQQAVYSRKFKSSKIAQFSKYSRASKYVRA